MPDTAVKAPRKSDLCSYPGCEAPDPQPPYRYLRDGVPSVTAISSMIDIGKASSFGYAASLIAATVAVHEPERWAHMSTADCTHDKDGLCAACRFIRGEHRAQWDAKAALGSHVHHLALSWAEGQTVAVEPEVNPYMDAVEQFYDERKPEWVVTERTVGYEAVDGRYRGKLDGICDLACPIHEGNRCRWLIDWKSGRFYPVEQSLQLSAYRYAYLTRWEAKTQIIEERVPAVDHAGVVLLDVDAEGKGAYSLRPLPADTETHGMFLDLLSIHGWHHRTQKLLEVAA